MLSQTKKVTYTALFTALATLFNILTVDTGLQYFVISLVSIPCFLAGVKVGPVYAFVTGFTADVLGAIIHPLGPYLPLIGLASGLLGFIPGMVFKYFKGNAYLKAAISFILCLIICTAGLNTYALYSAYSKGKTFFAYLALRFPFQAIVALINFILSLIIARAIALSSKGKDSAFSQFAADKVKRDEVEDEIKKGIENQ